MRDDIHIDIEFHEEEDKMDLGLGDLVRGQFTLTPQKDLEVELAGYKLMIEAQGEMDPEIQVFLNKYFIKTPKVLNKGEQYKFPFQFINHKYECFEGINAKMRIKLEVFAKLVPTQDKSLLDHLVKENSEFNPNLQFERTVYLSYPPVNKYQIKDTKLKAEVSELFGPMTCLVSLGLLITIFMIDWQSPSITAIIIGSVLVAMFIYMTFIRLIITSIDIRIEQKEQEYFELQLSHRLDWFLINELALSYTVMEEVLDASKREHIDDDVDAYRIYEMFNKPLFQSEQKKFRRPRRTIKGRFPFPHRLPGSIWVGEGGLVIRWLVRIEVKFLTKTPFRYDTVIKVSKQA